MTGWTWVVVAILWAGAAAIAWAMVTGRGLR